MDGRRSKVGPTYRLPTIRECSYLWAGARGNACARIARRADRDFGVYLGDYLYEYGAGQHGTARVGTGRPRALTSLQILNILPSMFVLWGLLMHELSSGWKQRPPGAVGSPMTPITLAGTS